MADTKIQKCQVTGSGFDGRGGRSRRRHRPDRDSLGG